MGKITRRNIWTRRNFSVLGGEVMLPDNSGYWLKVASVLVPYGVLALLGGLMALPIALRLNIGVLPTPDVIVSPLSIFASDLQDKLFVYGLRQSSFTEFITNWFGLAFLYMSLPPPEQIASARQSLWWLVRHNVRNRWLAKGLYNATRPIYFLARQLNRIDTLFSWLGGNILLASGGIVVLLFIIFWTVIARILLL